MAKGILVYDSDSERFDVLDNEGDSMTFGGFRCGYPLEVKVNGRFHPTRIEIGETWYLVGFEHLTNLNGLTVRFK